MNSKTIDYVNILLIFISFVAAYKLPFELFLFSYAFLGPLHYLTEINWLKEKNYFTKASSWWTVSFYIFALLISIYPIYKIFNLGWGNSVGEMVTFISSQSNSLLLAGFLFSISLIFFRKIVHLAISLVASISISLGLLHFLPDSILYVGIFLPTVVHVYLFTLLFMLFGAKKSKSTPGFASVVCLAFVPILIVFMDFPAGDYGISQQTIDSMNSSNMLGVSGAIAKWFDGGWTNGRFQVFSSIGLKIQMFIAFAYTYHYLNWFSKTSVIGWKNSLTNKKSILIVAIWIFTIGLYLYDFNTGFVALFFLSFLHVFLEFPLNVVTIKGLFTKEKK